MFLQTGTAVVAATREQTKKEKALRRAFIFGALKGTRTPGLLIRSQTLYPAELPARLKEYNTTGGSQCQAFLQNVFAKFGSICRPRQEMPGIGRSAVLFAGEGRLAAGAHTIKDLVQVLAAGVAQGKNLLRGLLQIRHARR